MEAHEPPNSLLRRQIPADAVEKTVLDVLHQVMTCSANLRPIIERHVQSELARAKQDSSSAESLVSEEKQLRRRLNLIFTTHDESDEADEQLKEIVVGIKVRLREVQKKIAMLEKLNGPQSLDPAAVGSLVASQFERLSANLTELPIPHLQRLVSALCRKMTVDLETREFSFEVCLPSWAICRSEAITANVGVAPNPAHPTSCETHAISGLTLACCRCEHERQSMKYPGTYKCTVALSSLVA